MKNTSSLWWVQSCALDPPQDSQDKTFMPIDLWDRPVELTIDGTDHFRRVSNSREALECLLTCWPTQSGEWYSRARKQCLQAVEGKGNHADAEAAFIKAAEEAGILRD